MSILIHQFVVHRLKETSDGKLALFPRTSCFDVSSAIEMLGEQLHVAYNGKPGKGVGAFIDPTVVDDANNDFPALLSDVLDESLDFHAFSVNASELLVKSLIHMGTVETGFLIFNRYEYLATDYLMIALIDTKQHIEVNNELDLAHRDHLDISKMQLAVRIDLTQYRVASEHRRYISFIKGRMGRKVSDFFMQFIGCEELVDVKQQNKQLLQNVDQYLASEQLDVSEKNNHRQHVADYVKQQADSGEDIALKDITSCLPVDEASNKTFEAFNGQQEQPLEPHFQADRGIVKSLAKFAGAGGGIMLNFDRKLLGERIQYNPFTDTLTIKGLPPNLKDQLVRAGSSDEEA